MRKFAILSAVVLVTTGLNQAARHALQAPAPAARSAAAAGQAEGASPPAVIGGPPARPPAAAEGGHPHATPAAGPLPAPPVAKTRPGPARRGRVVPAGVTRPPERPMFGPDGVPFRRIDS